MFELLIPFLYISSILSFIFSLSALVFLYSKTGQNKERAIDINENHLILITGCDSGIGLELAKYLLKTFKCKLMCGFLNFEPTSQGMKELSELAQSTDSQDRIFLAKLDLRCQGDVDSLVEKIQKLKNEGDQLFALVNNAGVMTYGEFDWLTWDHIQSQIDVNFTGTVRLTRAILPFIIQNKGRIINVSSVNDSTVFPGLSVYSATKSAISTWSQGLAFELRKFGVSVIIIRLGDFARLTNIMSRHESHQTAMWNGMSEKKKLMYKDFFHEFNGHLLKNYGMTSPRNFEESNLFRDFRGSLLMEKPPSSITCAPLGFKIFYFVVELLPTWLKFIMLDHLIRFAFRWKPPAVAVDMSSDSED